MDHEPTTDSTPPPQFAPRQAHGEHPGDSIGPYKLLEVIGEGGFGVVWLAERREPFVQRVALKIIRAGMDSRSVIARFEQERQALAVMDHPNVAKVLDGGVTPPAMGSRPYFVMEYVKGEPITEYCDRHRLSVRQRLDLFTSVCNAVQHAHMKGIIHRDLKPSNILASILDTTSSRTPREAGSSPLADSLPLIKVIDFGVAKAVSHTLTDKTIFTETGQMIGTPEYMSPEQAEMGATDIDTRTDIYSLGVVLYELLSGTLPFDAKSLRAAGYAEIQRIIREVDAPRPSAKLSTADDQTGAAIARARQADRDKIAGELRRELEWIPLKALRKDRARRYASAESLGADVRRYLDGKPLEAAPESRAYLLRKFVRRNRLHVGLVAAAFVVVSSAAAGAGVALKRERELRRRADEQWQAADAASRREDLLRTALEDSTIPSSRESDLRVWAVINALEERLIYRDKMLWGLSAWVGPGEVASRLNENERQRARALIDAMTDDAPRFIAAARRALRAGLLDFQSVLCAERLAAVAVNTSEDRSLVRAQAAFAQAEATLRLGQPRRTVELLSQLEWVRSAGSRANEARLLELQALAWQAAGEPSRARHSLEQRRAVHLSTESSERTGFDPDLINLELFLGEQPSWQATPRDTP